MFTVTAEDSGLVQALSGRDPLGVMPVWQRRARDLVPALTASSVHAEGFQVLLTALAWWPEFAHNSPNNTPKDQQKFFLLIEQAFARTCRCADVAWPLPGTRRLNSADGGVWMGLKTDHYLLDSPLANGVWGLYRGPARNAHLIDIHNRMDETLAKKIRQKTEVIAALFPKIRTAFRESGESVQIAKTQRHNLVQELKLIIERVPSRQIILDAFVTPAESAITKELALLWRTFLPADGISQFIALAIERLPGHAAHLQNVLRCEAYIAPLEAIFEYLASKANLRMADVEQDLAVDLIALQQSRDTFAATGSYEGALQDRVDQLLSLDLSSNQRLIVSLLEHHKVISDSRGNTPWLQISEQGRLECSLIVGAPAPEQLLPATAWRNSYYLDCLGGLSRQLMQDRGAR